LPQWPAVTDTVFPGFIRNLTARTDHDEFTSADGVLRAEGQEGKRYLHFLPGPSIRFLRSFSAAIRE